MVKIKETIERECCQTKDMKYYKGILDNELKRFNPSFCIYCGQIWVTDSEMGPAGSSEPILKKLKISIKDDFV